jgi:hypothetical protein|tara:strand:+ start:707 stop:1432 length:726 start_codon:yes stop_codon:yes gene_type:complete
MDKIDFKVLADLFPQVTKQKYLMKGGQTPCQPKGVRLKTDRVGDETINCTQFTTWIISQAFDTTWTLDQWSCWQVGSKAAETEQVPNFGPRVTMEWGIGSTHPGPGPWLVQYFTNPKTFAGHSMLVIAHDEKTDKILTLEANRSYGLDGAGWAEIGNLRDVINPGPNWMDKVSQTWESRLGSKPALHITQLSIDPKSIIRWLDPVVEKKELEKEESDNNSSDNWLTILLSSIVGMLSKRKV